MLPYVNLRKPQGSIFVEVPGVVYGAWWPQLVALGYGWTAESIPEERCLARRDASPRGRTPRAYTPLLEERKVRAAGEGGGGEPPCQVGGTLSHRIAAPFVRCQCTEK